MKSKSVNEELSVNEAYLKKTIGESFDTKYRDFKIPAFNYSDAFIVYISGMIDARVIEETILEPLMKYSHLPEGKIQNKSIECTSMLMEMVSSQQQLNKQSFGKKSVMQLWKGIQSCLLISAILH